MKENKKIWGGRRVNSGRKPTGKKYKTISISGIDFEIDKIKQNAKKNNKTISRFVLDKVLEKD